MIERRRRFFIIVILVLCGVAGYTYEAISSRTQPAVSQPPAVLGINEATNTDLPQTELAVDVLTKLEVKGRAPKTGYTRSQFGQGWATLGLCDVRNHILKRDLTQVVTKSETDCTVLGGTLDDPYTAKIIQFQRGKDTSDDVQIDHVVALSDAWQKGAQQISAEERLRFGNDSLNLLAVDGKTNNQKSDSDAASWLPPSKDFRCRYIARQIAVKQKYRLWVTEAEQDAMQRVLGSCPDQKLPIVSIP